MILKNYYYWFENVVNDYMCEKIIQYGNSLREEVAATGDQASQNMTPEAISKLKKEMRNSNVSWINEKWLYDMISPYVDKANKDAGWNFHIDYVEPVQFTKYKLNQYYNWHADSSEKIINNPNDLNFHGKVRKLSCIVFLSNPSDYTGGQLKFDFRNNAVGCNIQEIKQNGKGNMIVFPSFLWHKVFPVLSGERYSLVSWYIGKPFK
tara:strand:- start:2723 stop:3343 length:621 start_codon:yes stop_codon:yes gene_type:complete